MCCNAMGNEVRWGLMRDTINILGECMVELSPLDDPHTMRLGFAGDTFNTAWYLAQIWGQSGQVRFVTRIGEDEMSLAFLARAHAAGIETDFVQTDARLTMGLYMIHLKDGERSFSYWRETSAARHFADDVSALDRAFATSQSIYLSGITVAILDRQARENLATELGHARAKGQTVILDPNIRPRLWADADEARAVITRFARCADIVLPSFDDEAACFGDPDPQATAVRYLGHGAGLVVVKDGSRAVLTAAPDTREEHALPHVASPIDTTAAGDSFNAGFLANYLKTGDSAAAVEQGAALARAVIMGRGALVDGAVDALK